MGDLKSVVNFLFEVGILSKTPRSGFYFLGSGKQSVAEHVNRVTFIGYALAMIDGTVDVGRVLKMCLLHDIAEARTSDLNYVHQKYINAKETEALKDLASTLPFGEDMLQLLREYNDRKTPEALYAKDADQLELILSLKEQSDVGNTRADTWFEPVFQRLQTDLSKSLARQIFNTGSDEWWHINKQDKWWITGNKEKI